MSRIDIDALEDEWEDDDGDTRRARRHQASATAAAKVDALPVGRVTGVDRGRITVLLDGAEVAARYGGAMRGRKAVVGDRVRVKAARRESDTARLLDILERGTTLTRTADDGDDEARVIAANLDEVIIVVAADRLESARGFADRVLVAAEAGGMGAVVCINKIDLAPAADPRVETHYREAGYDVLRTSAETGAGLDDLRQRLAGRWTVLAGHSGVGKSSLFNRLVPDAEHAVGELGRHGGRHTTVRTRAVPVPGVPDAWLVDTPGVRSFGLAAVDPADLAAYFPELRGLECDLDDCRHHGDPGCVADDGEVDAARLASYRRLLVALGE